MKKVAVIENRLRDYVIETFKNHNDGKYELSYFAEWNPKSDSKGEYFVKSISDIKDEDYDILIIAVKENRYLSRLLTYLHDRNLMRIYVVRLFAMDKKLDFISDKDSYIDVIPERDDKPYLVHLETHVCDQCNLNCKACNNFAPFVKEPTYADLGQFENDLKNLRKLFSAIGRFFLLGGEPLLAPELCCDMIRMYRKYYPTNELRVLTNATLILTMKSEFWECLRENNVIIHISLYPPVKKQIAKIEQKLIEEKIQYLVFKEVTHFLKHWTKYPFEDEVYNNNVCGSAGCHYLRNGKISKCPDAIMIERMETDLKSKDDISLIDDISAWGVLRKLEAPIDLCKKCSYKRREVAEWQQVDEKAEENDWIIKHFYEAENDKLMKYNHDLKEMVEGQKVEIEQLKESIKEQKLEIVQLKEKVEEQKEEKVQLKEKIEEQKEETVQLKEKIEKLEKSIGCKEQNLKNTIARKNQLENEIEMLKKSYSYRIGLGITCIPRKIIKLIRKTIHKINSTGVFQICYRFKKDILGGYGIYKDNLLKYQNSSIRNIYFMEYAGTGDIYLTCSYLSSIGEIQSNDVLLVPNSVVAQISGHYSFKNIDVINNSMLFSLRIMERFYQGKIVFKPLLYESIVLIHSGIMRHMQGYNGLDFMSLLKIGYEINLNIPYTEKKWEQVPMLCNNQNVDLIFEKYHLKKGKTVLIAPYAGRDRLWGIPIDFYNRMANELIKLGYVVCINSNKNNKDISIKGTIPIFLPHEEMIKFCEQAGYFIGTRSGLCDIISSAKLKKKIIIYPNKKMPEGVSRWIDFFSLKNMGLCDDAIENEYEENLGKYIIRYFDY